MSLLTTKFSSLIYIAHIYKRILETFRTDNIFSTLGSGDIPSDNYLINNHFNLDRKTTANMTMQNLYTNF